MVRAWSWLQLIDLGRDRLEAEPARELRSVDPGMEDGFTRRVGSR